MRIKIIRNTKLFTAGQVLVINNKLAYKLISAGIAELTKDMTGTDYKVKG